MLKVYCEINLRLALFTQTSLEGIMLIPRCEKEQSYHCTGYVCVWGFCEFTDEIPEACSPQARFAVAASANIASALAEMILCDASPVPDYLPGFSYPHQHHDLITQRPHIQLKPDSGCAAQMQIFNLHNHLCKTHTH